jgi:hypothetical protein
MARICSMLPFVVLVVLGLLGISATAAPSYTSTWNGEEVLFTATAGQSYYFDCYLTAYATITIQVHPFYCRRLW